MLIFSMLLLSHQLLDISQIDAIAYTKIGDDWLKNDHL